MTNLIEKLDQYNNQKIYGPKQLISEELVDKIIENIENSRTINPLKDLFFNPSKIEELANKGLEFLKSEKEDEVKFSLISNNGYCIYTMQTYIKMNSLI